jgi:hypothetical protein
MSHEPEGKCPGCGKWECRHESGCPDPWPDRLAPAPTVTLDTSQPQVSAYGAPRMAAYVDARTPEERERDAALGWKITTTQFIPPPDRPVIGPSEAAMMEWLAFALWYDHRNRNERPMCPTALAAWQAWRVLNGRE